MRTMAAPSTARCRSTAPVAADHGNPTGFCWCMRKVAAQEHKTPGKFPHQGFRWSQWLGHPICGAGVLLKSSRQNSCALLTLALRLCGAELSDSKAGLSFPGARMLLIHGSASIPVAFTLCARARVLSSRYCASFLKPAGTSKASAAMEPVLTETSSVVTVISEIIPFTGGGVLGAGSGAFLRPSNPPNAPPIASPMLGGEAEPAACACCALWH